MKQGSSAGMRDLIDFGGLPCFRMIFYELQGHLMSLRLLIDFSGFPFSSKVFMTGCVQNRLRENNWNRRSYCVFRFPPIYEAFNFWVAKEYSLHHSSCRVESV